MDKRASRCPAEEIPYTAGLPVVGSVSFKTLTIIIAWTCFGVTALLWLFLIIPHLFRYKSPTEQRQIFRITLTPLVYSFFGLVSLQAYRAAPYLEAPSKWYEACALASLFLLYVNYVAPDAHTREEFFRDLQFLTKGRLQPGKGLRWFRVCPSSLSIVIPLTAMDRDAGVCSLSTCSSSPSSSSCRRYSSQRSGTVAARLRPNAAMYG
jgi:hypothetical protein